MLKDASTPLFATADLANIPLLSVPGTHLFPGTQLPLHLYNDADLALAQASLDTNRLVILAQPATPDAGIAVDAKTYHPIACVGRILHHRRRSDGRLDLAIEGIERVIITDAHTDDAPFSRVATTRVRETSAPTDRTLAHDIRALIVQITNRMPPLWHELPEGIFNTTAPGRLGDLVAGTFVETDEDQRALLTELNISQRLTHLKGYLIDFLLELATESWRELPPPPNAMH